ncbi:MAG TPA: polyhydroxyalkanoate synthesis regulator DNA-binding domain-containing protein [Polyangiaceae bacterium]
MGPVLTIKKYPNRRLYDTEASKYITMEELAERVRGHRGEGGRDVRVLDAKSDEDLTQPTLVQLLTEGGRAHLLPVPLLMQLVRMNDDSLAEFYTRYMTWALDLYFAMKQRAGSSINPFAQVPFDMGGALARLFLGNGAPQTPLPPPPAPVVEAQQHESNGEIAELRKELADLKQSLRRRKK